MDPSGNHRVLTKASELAPVIVDSLTLKVTKEGKLVGELPSAAHLNAMLRSEQFLQQFRQLDQVAKTPRYLEDFSILPTGYHDFGEGQHLLYVGSDPEIVESTETIDRFLDVMPFATSADRTNTVAAALTLLLRHHWLGQKPVVLVTSTKSHAGKGTVVDFISGGNMLGADILYESVDWPMQSQLQRQIHQDPDIGMICLDNVRLDSAGGRGKCIRSGFIESLITTPEVTLSSPGAGEPMRLKNTFLVAINSNDGSLSPDLLNRALPIHLAPRGDLQDRRTPIGNPKLQFLPQNQGRIAAELHGMIVRWKKAGEPLDEAVLHPMSPMAKTIGGILKANGYSDFLANYNSRKVADDPVRDALGILAASKPNQELRPGEWG